MLSRFQRPDADFHVEIDRTALHPGENLEARISLIANEEFFVRRASIELVCIETYVEKVITTHHRYGSQRSNREATLTQSRARTIFMKDMTMRRALPYSTDISFSLPPDAPLTAIGANVDSVQPGIVWTLTTSLDAANARDIRRSQEICVLKARAPGDAPSGTLVSETSTERCILSLRMPSGRVRSGEMLEGVLRAQAIEDFDVSEVRAELIRVEAFGEAEQDIRVDVASLQSNVSLSAGEKRDWRFKMNVGEVRAPSMKTRNSSVKWLVAGILARRMRFDSRVVLEISVDI